METKEQKIERLKKENKDFKEYIKLVKKSKVIELGLTQAVLKNIEYNEQKIKELEDKTGEMKLFAPGFCYWATLNPCTECRDKSKCLECTKSIEYVQELHNEIVKNMKEKGNE